MKTKLISLASMMVILVLMTGSCDDTTDDPQVTTGTISGTVTDNASGAGIVADVTLTPGNIIHTTGNDGSYSFQGLDPAVTYSLSAKSDNYDEMVKNNITVTAGETSTVNFALAVAAGGKTITVTSPAGGTTWQTGSQQSITWTSTNMTGNVKIELVKAGTVNSEIAAFTENDGSHQWTVDAALAAAGDYQVRVSSVDFPNVTGQSASFSLSNLPAPTAATQAATNVTATSATLNGIVDPNNSSTTVTFEYGTTTSYGSTVTAAQSPLSGSGNISVSADITGLTTNTTYHFRVKAVNANGTAMGSDLEFSAQQPLTVTDYDGNVYQTVVIGTQTWMKENLKTTHYRDGSAIPNVTDGNQWSNLSSAAYCDYNNNPNNSNTYGRLYNYWAAIDSRIAPSGWHVATNAEWTALCDFLGGSGTAGVKIKEAGYTHWSNLCTEATNESGFTALPVGERFSNDGGFANQGLTTYWYTTDNYYWHIICEYEGIVAYHFDGTSTAGWAVRCVKD